MFKLISSINGIPTLILIGFVVVVSTKQHVKTMIFTC
ncbi:hypothetical protein SAMN05421839_101109 [Halolactibacillus halophilus]|uniref:Uncharacterized protein n=1 Tax=Halolactibacillus halophilus TaxID=306540 RepID=A0A1I5KZ60_9BACI|nr:hypothetical protein SAMN05421839_101109 [Halolactibacillus halophilus]